MDLANLYHYCSPEKMHLRTSDFFNPQTSEWHNQIFHGILIGILCQKIQRKESFVDTHKGKKSAGTTEFQARIFPQRISLFSRFLEKKAL